MKRILCLCLAVLLTVAGLAGCSQDSETAVNIDSVTSNHRGDNMASIDTTSKGEIAENADLTNAGYPPLPQNLQEMYAAAWEMVRGFTLCQFQTDATVTTQIDGMDYKPIIDTRFNTYDKLESYLAQYFTDEFIRNNLLTREGCVRELEGVAYVVDASGADDQTYAGHVFTVDSQTDSQIDMTATVYYCDDVCVDPYFFTTPDDPSDYTVKEMKFTLVYTDQGWRYSQFPYIQG